jgi:hypothetical protein
MCKWIADTFLEGDAGKIVSDTSGNQAADRSPVISSYVPDAYVTDAGPYRVIIGEAETQLSVESMHAMQQIKAFTRYCSLIGNSLFVIAVPWQCVAYMKNTLTIWARRERLDVSCCKVPDWLAG